MKLLRNISYYRYIFSKSKDEYILPVPDGHILILTVAFNNVEFVELQISLLKKFLQDEFSHCIVDNSTIPSVRQELKAICIKYKVGYVGLPKGPFSDHKSHGAAMHWAFVQVVRRIKPRLFAFLDHDIFPYRNYQVSGKFHQGVFGRVVNSYIRGGGYLDERTDNAPYWSLWAGFCFFDFARFKRLNPWNVNFSSKHFFGGYFLDTGGGLWDSIYSKTDYPGNLASFRKVKWNSQPGDGDQNDSFEIFDEAWIHFVSLSNWRSIQNLERKKENLLDLLQEMSEFHLND